MRNSMEDIKAPEPKRSIREVSSSRYVPPAPPMPEPRRREVTERYAPPTPPPPRSPQPRYQEPQEESEPETDFNFIQPRKKRSYSKIFLLIGAVVLVIAAFFVIVQLFSGAHVKVLQKTQTGTLNAVFTATKNDGSLPFQIVSLSEDISGEIQASGTAGAPTVAHGIVTVSNSYSSASQFLVKSTRFQTADGTTFRLDNSITVPGTTLVSGKTVPGHIDASVTAVAPGAKYNIAPSDFTLPGYIGSPKFAGFTAHSAQAMKGGSSGTQNTASPDKINAAASLLKDKIEKELVTKAQSSVPDGFLFYSNAEKTVFTNLPQADGTATGTVRIGVHGVLSGMILPKDALAKAIAKKGITGYDGSDVEVSNIADLTFAWKTDVPDVSSVSSLDFTLTGKPQIVWTVDTQKLISDLAGQPRKNLSSILANYKGIEKAEANILPFWSSAFPSNPKKITAEISTTI